MSDAVHKAYNFAYYLTGDTKTAEQIVMNSLKFNNTTNIAELFNGIYCEFKKVPMKKQSDSLAIRKSIDQPSVIKALQCLSPIERAHIVLRDVLGYKAKDIANYLKKDEASVRSSISCARFSLLRVLRELKNAD